MNFNKLMIVLPKYSETWTFSDIKKWLNLINMDQYYETFVSLKIDGTNLWMIDDQVLELDLQINNSLHLNKILRWIENLNKFDKYLQKNKITSPNTYFQSLKTSNEKYFNKMIKKNDIYVIKLYALIQENQEFYNQSMAFGQQKSTNYSPAFSQQKTNFSDSVTVKSQSVGYQSEQRISIDTQIDRQQNYQKLQIETIQEEKYNTYNSIQEVKSQQHIQEQNQQQDNNSHNNKIFNRNDAQVNSPKSDVDNNNNKQNRQTVDAINNEEQKSLGGEINTDWTSQQGITNQIKNYLIEKNEEVILRASQILENNEQKIEKQKIINREEEKQSEITIQKKPEKKNPSTNKNQMYLQLQLIENADIKDMIYINQQGTSIGSQFQNGILFSDKQFCDLSQFHSKITFEQGKFLIEDLGSSSGTYVRIVPNNNVVVDDVQIDSIAGIEAKEGLIIQVGEEQITIEEVAKTINDETKEPVYTVLINTFHCFNKQAEKMPLYLTIKNEKYYIGRNSQDRFKKSKEMSGKHFYFQINQSGVLTVNDNNSTNGTWLRLSSKRQPSQPIELPENCIIRFGFNYKFISQKIKQDQIQQISDKVTCMSCNSSTANLYTIYTCHHTVCEDCKKNISPVDKICKICQKQFKAILPSFKIE